MILQQWLQIPSSGMEACTAWAVLSISLTAETWLPVPLILTIQRKINAKGDLRRGKKAGVRVEKKRECLYGICMYYTCMYVCLAYVSECKSLFLCLQSSQNNQHELRIFANTAFIKGEYVQIYFRGRPRKEIVILCTWVCETKRKQRAAVMYELYVREVFSSLCKRIFFICACESVSCVCCESVTLDNVPNGPSQSCADIGQLRSQTFGAAEANSEKISSDLIGLCYFYNWCYQCMN